MAAKARIAGAIATTAHFEMSESHPGSNAEVIPRTGASSKVRRERRLRPAGPVDHRQRHQRHHRHPDVDERDDDAAGAEDVAEVLLPPGEVRGEIGGGLDAREGDHRDHERIGEVAERRRRQQVELVGERRRVPDDDEPDDDDEELQQEVGGGDRDEPALAPVAREADEVDDGDDGDHAERHEHLRRSVRELARDRPEVVRDGDRGQRDHDHVVDEDRPPGDEGGELVEGVTSERVGAAALVEHRAALDVGHRRQHVDEARDREDHRRHPEAVVGHHPERVVDRERDRRMGDRPEPGHAQEPAPEGRPAYSSVLQPGARIER